MLRGTLASLACTMVFATTAQAQIHVTNLSDAGPGSLRDAIVAANIPGPDDIVFDVSGTIPLLSNLPPLTDSDTRILGSSAPDTLSGPDVVLDCSAVSGGLVIDGAAACTIQGLRVDSASGRGISLMNGASGNKIGSAGTHEGNVLTGCAVGLRIADVGTQLNTAYNNEIIGNAVGVGLISGASLNRIGGLGAGERNLINGNSGPGVRVLSTFGVGQPVSGNIIEGNSIGTSADGTAVLGNGSDGVQVEGQCLVNSIRHNYILFNANHGVVVTAESNTVGPGNVISGNSLDGVKLGPGSTVRFNIVEANVIGLDAPGMNPIPNGQNGVSITHGASENELRGNTISGNLGDGIDLYGNDPRLNVIFENRIGTDFTGNAPQPNGMHGIHLDSNTTANTIEDNVISGNVGHGIQVSHCGSEFNTILGNRIGVGFDGETLVPNGMSGIRFTSGFNTVGGTGVDDGNVISANADWGIEVHGSLCSVPGPLEQIVILGNLIGVTAAGAPAGNGAGGIWLGDSTTDSKVGDDPAVAGAANVIRHNIGAGVQVGEAGAATAPTGNAILTNSIADNAGLGIALTDGGNDLLPPPVLTSADTISVNGENTLHLFGFPTRVQVFYSTDDEGRVFVGETIVPAMDLTWTVVAALPAGVQVVATNASVAPFGGLEQTSQFSAAILNSPGVGYCFGDPFSGTPCPCDNDNDGSVLGSGCDNGSFASGARLVGSGIASVSADTLVLSTTHLEGGNSGLYFQANNDLSPGNVWGDGLQCAGGQLRRLGVRFADAGGYSDTSGWATSISVKAGNVIAGDTKHYQCWYRTTVNPPCGLGVNDFNSSNGYKVTLLP